MIGLGYVGLPVAVGMARAHGRVVGFDIDAGRIAALRRRARCHGRVPARGAGRARPALHATTRPTSRLHLLHRHRADADRRQSPARPRRRCAAPAARRAGLAPGRPRGDREHGLSGRDRGGVRAAAGGGLGPAPGRDFQLGYSPERINPGDREHRLETIAKVVAADDPAALRRAWRRSTARSSRPGCIGRPRSRWPRPPR